MMKKYKPVLFSLLLMQPIALDVFAAQEMQFNDMIVVAQNDIAVVPAISQDISVDPADDGSGSLFGLSGGYFHPYVSVSEEYSDNLFNVDEDTKENWLTQVSPGLWFALPRTKEVPISITPHNTSPGGLQLALHDVESFERYHFYLLGGLDVKFYSEDSDLNDTDGKVEGLFQYNLPGGLSLQAIDRYSHGQDRFDADNSTQDGVRRYNSNIAQGTVDWAFTEKLSTKVDYTNFYLDYSDDQYDFLDRTDNAVSVYAIYDYSPKTDFLLEYRFIDVSYDETVGEVKDNTNNFIYAGIRWATSEKVFVRLKAGYQKKEYDDDLAEAVNSNSDLFAFEGEVTYRFTVKTNIALKMSNKIDESNSRAALNKKVFGVSLRYNQQFTDHWKGICFFGYKNDDYGQVVAGTREDDRYTISPALQYRLRDWLMGELRYSYDTRSSSDDFYDYNTNRVMLSLHFAL
jgi:hypothetical protein